MKIGKIKKSIAISAITCGLILGIWGMLSLYTLQDVVEQQTIEVQSWKLVNLREATPTGDETLVLAVMSYPHQAAPAAFYVNNITNYKSTAYEYYDGIDNEMVNETPYDTTFDIVVKMRVNQTHAYNSTDAEWVLSWIRANITCADLGIAADTGMLEYNVTGVSHGSDYLYIHYVMNNGGAGYTLNRGQPFNATSFKFYAYY